MSDATTTSIPVTIRNVTKSYGDFKALDDVSLDIDSGEFITLLGPSGSGKTTLLMVIAGFVRPDSGSVRFDQDEVITLAPHLRNVGMVFQNYALFPHMNVFQNVAYPLKLRKTSAPDIEKRVMSALDLVELGELRDRRVDQLSGGQKQRVALARAIVFEPRVLLMDEPLSALDKKLREQMQIEIKHLHERLGMTTIYVTHDQREALTMSDRVVVVNQGQFEQIDTPNQLYERPASHFVADFIGESSFLPVNTSGNVASLGSTPLNLAEPIAAADKEHLLVIRPEKLEILTNGSDTSSFNCIDGTVKEMVYQGESFLLYVTLSSGENIVMRQPSRREVLANLPDPGQPISLGLHPEDTIVVPRDA